MSKFLLLAIALVSPYIVKAAAVEEGADPVAMAMRDTEIDPQTGCAKMYEVAEAQQKIEAGGMVSVYVRVDDYDPDVRGGTFKSFDDMVYEWNFGELVVENGTILEMTMPARVFYYSTLVGRLMSLHMYTFGEDNKPFYFDPEMNSLCSSSIGKQHFKLVGKRILSEEAPYDIIGAVQLGLAPE